MSNISYPAKPVAGDGGSTYLEGRTVPNTELQGDFDEVANKVNGQLDETNLRAGTQIPNSMLVEIDGTKVADHAENESAFASTTSPGDSGTPSLPTNLEEEIERLRYRIRSMTGYSMSASYVADTNSTVGITWLEPPINGRNLIQNDGFEAPIATSGDAPPSWTEVGTLTGSAISVASQAATGKHKRSVSISTDVAGEGISQVLTGLKADTKYLIGMQYVRSLGGVSISTAGGLAAGNDYQDFTLSDSVGTGVNRLQGIVQTDSSATDITVTILGTAGGGNLFFLSNAWAYELTDAAPSDHVIIPEQVATHDTAEALPATFTASQWNWETVGELTLSQYSPAPGYRLVYECRLSFTGETGPLVAPTGLESEYGFRVQLDSGGGASTVDGPYIVYTSVNSAHNQSSGGFMVLRHVVENPTPGLTYTFTTDVGAYNDNSNDQRLMLSPLGNGSVQSISRARLSVERL